MPIAATSTRSLPICMPSIWITSRSSLDRSDAIHSAMPLRRQRHEPARGRRLRHAVPGDDRNVALRQPHSAPELARRDVDQHQVHRPAAKPVLGLRRRPARQRNFLAVEAAHPRPIDRNLAAVEADLARRRAPAVADAASAAAVRRAGKLLRVLAHHLFNGADPAVRQKRSNELSTSRQAIFEAWRRAEGTSLW